MNKKYTETEFIVKLQNFYQSIARKIVEFREKKNTGSSKNKSVGRFQGPRKREAGEKKQKEQRKTGCPELFSNLSKGPRYVIFNRDSMAFITFSHIGFFEILTQRCWFFYPSKNDSEVSNSLDRLFCTFLYVQSRPKVQKMTTEESD